MTAPPAGASPAPPAPPATGATATPHMHLVVASPLGPLTLVAAGDADQGALCGLYLQRRRHPPSEEFLGTPAVPFNRDDVTSPQSYWGNSTSSTGQGPLPSVLAEAARQLDAYFAGTRTAFDLPLAPHGTPFQRAVWAELVRIPYGETMTYGELARRLGRPSAARAVGAANGRNPISIVVPCHRLVGSSGGLTGYGGGIESKRRLLDLERGPAALLDTLRDDSPTDRQHVRHPDCAVR